MTQKKTISIAIIVSIVILTGMFIWRTNYNQKNITRFSECVAAGYPILDSLPAQCSIPSGKTFTQAATKETDISLEGETICLPHKDANGPHTMECAMGLKTDVGKYYGLSTNPYDTTLSVTNRRVRVSGTLKQDTNSIYLSEGAITVTAYEFLD